MHPIDIRKYKIELREKCKFFRKNLDPDLKGQMDAAVAERVRKLYQYRAAETIMIYVSTPIEVDTYKIIENAFKDGKKVAVPRCIPSTRQMEFHYINSVDQLSPGTFSVLEPDPSFPIVKDFSKTLMLVPGFMFDFYGYRLGYGMGYYDRYMSRYNGSAVGMCYSSEIKRHMFHGRYDRAVDTLVSDKWIRKCKKYTNAKKIGGNINGR